MEIKELRKRYNLTQTKLAQELGVTSRTVQNWEAGKVIPDNMQIAIDMLADKYETISRTDKASEETNAKSRYLPLIPFGAVAGFPSSDNAGIALKDCPLYSVPDFVALGADYLIKVTGDSMIPRYNQGDLLACRMITDRTWLQWGKVYVLDTDQGVLVKRLLPCEKSDDFVVCRSENSANYPDFELPKASIRSMSIVVGMIGIE